jgi:hypothetical protein
MNFFKIFSSMSKSKETRFCFFILFLAFYFISPLKSFALDLSVRGNSLFAGFLGRNNYFMFSLRNLELSASGSSGFFFAKAQLDIVPQNLYFFTDAVTNKNSVTGSFLGKASEPEELFRVKELFVSTRGLPFFRFTIGRFYGAVGDANSRQFFDRFFVERPFTIRKFFGQDGFLDEGIELSLFPPLPWTLEILSQIFDGSETSFGGKGSYDFTYLFAIKNVFGKESVGGGFSLFWAFGKNGSSDRLKDGSTIISDNFTDFFGGDVFFAFRPFFYTNIGYIVRRMQEPSLLTVEGGIFTEIQIAPVDIFYASFRPEIFGIPRLVEYEGGGSKSLPLIFDLSIAGTLLPSRDVKFRLQWTGNFSEESGPQNIFYLQAIFEIR